MTRLWPLIPREDRVKLDEALRRYCGPNVSPVGYEHLREMAATCWHRSEGATIVDDALRAR